jgi:hypothetical protein
MRPKAQKENERSGPFTRSPHPGSNTALQSREFRLPRRFSCAHPELIVPAFSRHTPVVFALCLLFSSCDPHNGSIFRRLRFRKKVPWDIASPCHHPALAPVLPKDTDSPGPNPLPDPSPRVDLTTTLYGELHKLAVARMAAQGVPQTLQPTALVHEAWLRAGRDHGSKWANRTHFFATVAEAGHRTTSTRSRSSASIG